MNKYKLLYLLIVGVILFSSCSEELDTKPANTVSQSQIEDLAKADPEAFAEILEPQLAGMYSWLVAYNALDRTSVRHDDHGIKGILHMADMMGEDIVQTSGSYGWYYFDYLLDSKLADYFHPLQVWTYFYRNIKNANDIIVQIPADTENATLQAYLGQALATRAYSYHYLVQFYQKTYFGNEDAPGVPLILEVPADENPRAPLRDIYAQMIEDLTRAIDLLDGYNRPTKAFINQNVAYGFLARVYLHMRDWENAVNAANSARQGLSLMSGAEYLDGFKYINNPGWMWGSIVTVDLDIVQSGIVNHPSFISTMSYGYASLTGMHKAIDRRLYDHMGLDDFRKKAYQSPELTTFPGGGFDSVAIPAYVNGKFGPSDDGADNTQDLVYMRVAEMYLIEAEALAELDRTGEAEALLLELMAKRDPNYSLPSGSLLDEIRIQRRIELWGELGIALFDIKRLKQGINRDYPGSNHNEDAQLVVEPESWLFTYQLPTDEIDNNIDISPTDNNP